MSDDLPPTERANPQTAQLDLLPTADLVALLVEDQRDAVEAVRRQSELLAQAADEIARRIRLGGRLHYVGAGTSGRLGALDAAEMPPTFGLAPEIVCAHLAGGTPAFFQAVEGAEDDREAGEAAIGRDVRFGDAVVGISASGGAPYVVAAIERARAIGAFTIALTGVPHSSLATTAELAIVLETGPGHDLRYIQTAVAACARCGYCKRAGYRPRSRRRLDAPKSRHGAKNCAERDLNRDDGSLGTSARQLDG